MFSLFVMIFFFIFIGKTLGFAIRACWSITRILFSVFLFPLLFVGALAAGLLKLAVAVIIVFGIAYLVKEAL